MYDTANRYNNCEKGLVKCLNSKQMLRFISSCPVHTVNIYRYSMDTNTTHILPNDKRHKFFISIFLVFFLLVGARDTLIC